MEKIPTAEEIMQKHLDPHDCLRLSKCYEMTLESMIEFAKLHVEAALEAAANEYYPKDKENFELMAERFINAYSLDKIK